MKLAHFHFGKEGGAERFFVHLVNALHERGVEQKSVIRPNRTWQKDIEGATELKLSNFRNLSLDRILLPIHAKKLATDWQPDVMFAWMPRACRLMPSNVKPLRIARLGDYPLRLDYFKNIDVLVCNTPGIVQHVKDMGWDRGTEMISNFTYAKASSPVLRKALDTPEDAFVVSSMGRFVPRKGFDVLIKTMEFHKTMYLWIMGGGEEEENLKALATKLGVEGRIRFAGWQKDPNAYVKASDVFAAASSHEPLGNIILEAWAQDVPVVSTKSEGPSWFMNDGKDGLMVEIGDAEGFATAFTKLENNKSLCNTLAKGGKNTLQAKFSKQVITDAYLNLFSRKRNDYA